MPLMTQTDVDLLRTDRLMSVARSLFPKTVLSDAYLLEKLVSEEATLQRELRCFFTPTEVIPDTYTQDQITALTNDTTGLVDPTTVPVPYQIEPAYDYDPSLIQSNAWGLIELRNRLIITVRSIVFAYPQPNDTLYQIPTEWIRIERKTGRINLVPVNGQSSLPLNAYLLSVLTGDTIVPQMIQVSYRCGMTNARVDYPDLVDVIRKRAVINVIEDEFLPQSGSISADGFSQSRSLDTDKYRETSDRKVKVLRSSIQGITMMVM